MMGTKAFIVAMLSKHHLGSKCTFFHGVLHRLISVFPAELASWLRQVGLLPPGSTLCPFLRPHPVAPGAQDLGFVSL
jgi:hypothetical protein